MVSVHLTVLPIASEANRPLRSIVSGEVPREKNSFAHTPTVNAGSSLPVADTILQFLSTLRPYPEPEWQSTALDTWSEGDQTSGVQLLLSALDDVHVVSGSGKGKEEPFADAEFDDTRPRSASHSTRSPEKNSGYSASSDLLEMMTSPVHMSAANDETMTIERTAGRSKDPETGRSTRPFPDGFMISQASIAQIFGIGVDENSKSEKKTGSAQNDNRASARYRQQSPESWFTFSNPNRTASPETESLTAAGRAQILRATFTEAGTYQFG